MRTAFQSLTGEEQDERQISFNLLTRRAGVCSVNGCGKHVRSRNVMLCKGHYAAKRRAGSRSQGKVPWTPWEDGVIQAARQARVSYSLIVLVMPNRTPEACKVRANVLRRVAGVPSRDYAHLEQIRFGSAAKMGSDRLAAAIRGIL